MEFPVGYRKASGGRRCCVPNCSSVKRKSDNISFHNVPTRKSVQKVERKNLFGNSEYVNKRAEWLRILNVKDEDKELLVCSLHFVKENYSLPDLEAKFRILKKSAVPQYPNMNNEKILTSVQRKKRKEAREVKKTDQKNPEEPNEQDCHCENIDCILVDEILADHKKPDSHRKLLRNYGEICISEIDDINVGQKATNCHIEGCSCFDEKATQVTSSEFDDIARSDEKAIQATHTGYKTIRQPRCVCNCG